MKKHLIAVCVVLAAFAELSAFGAKAPAVKPRGALVLRFDDNKPVAQWREVAEIFESAGGRCSFAVNACWLSDEQWEVLRVLSERGHEIMDHTGQHAIFKLALESAAAVEKCRHEPFFDHAEGNLVLCSPELDIAHSGNVRVMASMTNGLCSSGDPLFVKRQKFSQKFYVPSVGKIYGFGKDCGGGQFKKGSEQRCSDFWGRWTSDSFASCEIVLLVDEAVQPSKALLRAQARNSVSRFVAHGIPSPRTWIRPGGWETPVDWRRMRDVFGGEFGYLVADSTCGIDTCARSPWCYGSDYAFFDFGASVEEVFKKAVSVIKTGHFHAYVSHQWTKDRSDYLRKCRSLANMLKESGISMTTYAHVADK